MTDYGVIPTGFNRKPLAVILAEIEASLITEFGPDVIQTSQSPLGQINGLMADLATQLWEVAEDVYQSYDVNQAESIRLDTLGRLRLVIRGLGESDVDFRKAITNQGEARIDIQDIVRAIRSIAGVTYAQVFVNDAATVDENLLPAGTVCVAVLGGDDGEIAAAIRRYVVPGISTFGNVQVSTALDGFCRTLSILRPVLVPVKLTVNIRATQDVQGCPPPSVMAIRQTLVTALSNGLINGENISHFRIRSIIESAFPNVEVLNFTGKRDNIAQIPNQQVDIAFIELATVALADVTVNA